MVRWSTLTADEQIEETREYGEHIDGYDDEKPSDLQADTRALWQCFGRLSDGRGWSGGEQSFPLRLPSSEIRALYEFEDLRRIWTPTEFVDLVQLCDREYIKCHGERARHNQAERERKAERA